MCNCIKNNPFFLIAIKSANAWPHTSSGPGLETQNRPNYWYARWFFGWCSLRQRNWRLTSGQKSATIVTDPLIIAVSHMLEKLDLCSISNYSLEKFDHCNISPISVGEIFIISISQLCQWEKLYHCSTSNTWTWPWNFYVLISVQHRCKQRDKHKNKIWLPCLLHF